MNILRHYTLRCLKQNRARTLVTIIGIILSVALFTAVAEGAVSGQTYLVNVAKAQEGAYHGIYGEVSDQELEELAQAPELEALATLDQVGWAHMGNQESSYPYLRIRSMSENLTQLLSLRLLEGRMPESDTELLISDRMEANTGVSVRVGQTLTLTVGQRITSEGLPLGEHNPYMGEEETLTDTQERIYTVVGVYMRTSSTIEGYEMPGSLALTVGPGLSGDHIALFTLKHIGDVNDFIAAHPYGTNSDVNRDLLLYSGVSGNRALVQVLYGLVAILFGLIFFGSVALIYNSFSISVSERTKQFGLLKSIGATNRQLRRAVLTEAGMLCLIAIPLGLVVGCGGIGLTLGLLRPSFDRIINLEGNQNVPMKLALSAPALVLAAGIGLLTALVSAWIPARRATRLSPIAAIRQSGDVKIRAKEVKVSKLTGKLFGFPGLLASKNFKRNRKQYRSTVVSLFMSIVLFISAASFANYLRQDVAENVDSEVADLIVSQQGAPSSEGRDTEAEWMEDLRQRSLSLEYVEEAASADVTSVDLMLPVDAATPEALASDLYRDNGFFQLNVGVFFLPEEDYRALCSQTGADPEARQAVAYASQRLIHQQENGIAYQICPLIRDGALPVSVNTDNTTQWKESEMVYLGPVLGEDGTVVGQQYVPHTAFSGENGSWDYDPDQVVTISPEEAAGAQTLVIGGLLEERPLASQGQNLALYLPKSLASELTNAQSTTSYLFLRAPQHEAALKALKQTAQDMDIAPEALWIYDTRSGRESTQALLLVLNVFTFGFITLISLIAAANVFNTISTNVALRRREFATLRSVGMGNRAFGRMTRFECLLYGSKALLWGLPVALGVSWLIWKAVSNAFITGFRLPWVPMAVATGSVFLVVFASMLYATGKIKKDNPIDALRTETM